ncbi:MAG TPA: ROK family transcriptional regulator, partial [Bacillales bacterium]|nr:ROK family transcriptional regulator [Bacillales bacterium]
MLSKLQEIQNANTRRVIQLVREKGPMSRADLSEKTGIPQPTMTRMIEKLIVGNILKERGLGSSSGGRRPILVTFNENCSYALGVELGRSEVKAALTNLNGKMLSFRKKETDPDFSQKRLITEVHCLIRQTIDDSKVDPALILGVGVGVPGPLNKSENGRISPPNFYGEIDIPLKKMMEERSVYEVTIDNDANCAALAEKWFGDGRDVKNFAYILADVGIGSGLILNHDIYRGTYGEAGEIGHSTIDAFGEQCYCGSYGCLETCASLPVILKRLEKQLKMASEDERGLYLNKTIKF